MRHHGAHTRLDPDGGAPSSVDGGLGADLRVLAQLGLIVRLGGHGEGARYALTARGRRLGREEQDAAGGRPGALLAVSDAGEGDAARRSVLRRHIAATYQTEGESE